MISLFRGLALKKNRLEFINAKRRLMYTLRKCLVVMSCLLCYHNIGRWRKPVQTLLEKSLMRDKI